MTSKTILVAVLAASLLGLFGGVALQKVLHQPNNPTVSATVGQIRPAFSMQDISGELRDISEWDSKIIVLNFWATWCPPCRHEIPAFIKLQRKYASQNVQFIGIAIDDLDKTKAFAQEMGINYPILVGDTDATELSRVYGNTIGALPFTVVIDTNGIITSTHPGELSFKTMEQLIQPR